MCNVSRKMSTFLYHLWTFKRICVAMNLDSLELCLFLGPCGAKGGKRPDRESNNFGSSAGGGGLFLADNAMYIYIYI